MSKRRPHIKAGLKWLRKQGKNIEGSMLNAGSGSDRYRYKRFFPKVTQYRNLDKKKLPRVDIVANVQNMPNIKSNSEDCILAHRLMSQIFNVDATLKEFRRVLKKKGILLISFPCEAWNPPSHRRNYTKEEAIQYVEKYFEIKDLQEYFEKGKLFWTLIRATPK